MKTTANGYTLNDMKLLLERHPPLLIMEGMEVRVTVLDVRVVFNRVDALVTPATGSGQKWVAADRLRW